MFCWLPKGKRLYTCFVDLQKVVNTCFVDLQKEKSYTDVLLTYKR